MLFTDKYPKAKVNELYEHGDYTYEKQADNCYVCGRMTHFYEKNVGTYICSEECDDELYSMIFMKAIKK